ncbi:juxtaposed with another zinc finger protein 1-like [Antedon mediterranea]|uniref:juxtaposed with another zinc finger protein 1-like n=1 Tax=Antedon mediterranea TaxID=105859 RepID=UPI003AF62BBF
MAFFFVNVCRFSGCNLNFSSVNRLIEHIEDAHIDKDPGFLEKQELQQPTSLALSYVKRFVTEAAKNGQQNSPIPLIQSRKKLKNHLNSMIHHVSTPVPTPRSSTPTGSEFDEELGSESDSDNSWTTQDEFSSDLILRMASSSGTDDKPFVCPVPGCKKRYKNANGIKYHARNGHRKEIKIKKTYKCRCSKSYKTAQGLRHHMISHHPPTVLTPSPSPKAVQPLEIPQQNSTPLLATTLPNLSIPTTPLTPTSSKGIILTQLNNVLATPTSAGVVKSVEPGTPVTPGTRISLGSPTSVMTKSSTPGFTIITMPSQITGNTITPGIS